LLQESKPAQSVYFFHTNASFVDNNDWCIQSVLLIGKLYANQSKHRPTQLSLANSNYFSDAQSSEGFERLLLATLHAE
jgi:hypothetical protein